MEFVCESCGWSGTQPVFDAHLNGFCPTCSRPVDFAELVRMRQERRAKRSG